MMRPASDFPINQHGEYPRYCGRLDSWPSRAEARKAVSKALFVEQCTECQQYHAHKLPPLEEPLTVDGMEARVAEANAEGWSDGKKRPIPQGVDYRHVSLGVDIMTSARTRVSKGQIDPDLGLIIHPDEAPVGRKRDTVTLATKEGPRTVLAQLFSGLAVHPSLGIGWNVTHALSGMMVANFPKHKQAIAAAKELALVTDWTLDVTKEPGFDDIAARARAVIAKLKLAA